jgi:hypothetical protein
MINLVITEEKENLINYFFNNTHTMEIMRVKNDAKVVFNHHHCYPIQTVNSINSKNKCDRTMTGYVSNISVANLKVIHNKKTDKYV